MRYVALAGALVFMLFTGRCEAQGLAENISAESAAAEEGMDEDLNPLDPDYNEDPGGPVDQVGVMSPDESYDENTGMPDVVDSDSSMDVE